MLKIEAIALSRDLGGLPDSRHPTSSTTRHRVLDDHPHPSLHISSHLPIRIWAFKVSIWPIMVRIKYTGGASAVQMQQAPVQNKTQSESEEMSRVRFQENLVLQQQQSLEMVQIMLHVSVSSCFMVALSINIRLTPMFVSSGRCFISGLSTYFHISPLYGFDPDTYHTGNSCRLGASMIVT